MQDETPNDVMNKEDIIDLASKGDEKENNGTLQYEDGVSSSLIDGIEEDVRDRRKHPRSEFTYPTEFKVFSQNLENMSFNGYLKDVSMSGACLEFDDKYGRLNLKNASDVKIKISFSVPNEDKVSILAIIRWITKEEARTFSVKMGIEFQEMDSWQSNIIEKLIGMKNKDHNMMWNLWEQYNNWR